MAFQLSGIEIVDRQDFNRNASNTELQTNVSTQVQVEKHIRTHIAPTSRQLEILTQLIQGIRKRHQPNSSPTASTGARFKTASNYPARIPLENYFCVFRTVSLRSNNLPQKQSFLYCQCIFASSLYFRGGTVTKQSLN